VPSGKSIACSTVEALEWDASFKANADPSGRAISSVHGKS
jgi:asparagine synthase (glutamine-hydrolysing)